MNIEKLPTYQEVLDKLNRSGRTKHLLLGNGFSMAYDSGIFSYNALSTFIEKSEDDLLKKLFTSINTKNFELIMQQLDLFIEIAQVFSSDKLLVDRIKKTSENLKHSLIDAVKKLHPEHVFTIPEEKSKACCSFFDSYLSNGGNIFSTNYDLLLYWVLMRNESITAVDGFGRELENFADEFIPEDELEFSELRWGKYKKDQTIYYLHGALPLFDTGIDIIKEEYDGNYLLEKINARMEKKEYPIFVTSGNAKEKLIHIMHNKYLSFCYDKFASLEGSLITFGFNFGDNDSHIIDAINIASNNGKNVPGSLWSIYIGVYSDSDLQHIENIKSKFKCKKLHIYNAKSANVWSNQCNIRE